jgi:probable O-glycosylation ligase (exosortase A-associated)
MLLTAAAILGTQSRGAFLGGAAMAALLWLKSRNKLVLLVIMLLIVPALLVFMPESWHAKMGTIQTYEEDSSAMGRIVAWQFAMELASQRLLGGGFGCFTPEAYLAFAPELVAVGGKYQDAHSIYFQVLGNHGFIGLIIYVALLLATWRHASGLMRLAKPVPHLKWAYDLSGMCQVSLIGFMVAGAFLGLAYFDLFFALVALVVIARSLAEQDLARSGTNAVPDRKAAATIVGATR